MVQCFKNTWHCRILNQSCYCLPRHSCLSGRGLCHHLLPVPFLTGDDRDWTWDLLYSKNTLYLWATAPLYLKSGKIKNHNRRETDFLAVFLKKSKAVTIYRIPNWLGVLILGMRCIKSLLLLNCIYFSDVFFVPWMGHVGFCVSFLMRYGGQVWIEKLAQNSSHEQHSSCLTPVWWGS